MTIGTTRHATTAGAYSRGNKPITATSNYGISEVPKGDLRDLARALTTPPDDPDDEATTVVDGLYAIAQALEHLADAFANRATP